MDFEAFKRKLNEVRARNPVWFGIESDAKPSVSDILHAEACLGVKLPDDYKVFIRENGGGYFGFSNVYSLEDGSDWNIVDLNGRYADIRGDYLIFSENGSGDFYGFKVVNDTCEPYVYFYDHEITSWQEKAYDSIFDYLDHHAFRP